MYSKWVNDLHNQPFIEMILIPSGYFIMGDEDSIYDAEKPEKEVFLHDFYISKYPITNQQFHHFIQESGYSNSEDNFLRHWETQPDGSKSPPQTLLNHPVVYVNWFDCYAFCKTYGLTLPSEAQWEKAARGTDKRTFPWGNEQLDLQKPQCNFSNIFDSTTPVGTFDGSRPSYNGTPIQKGTSPYGIEDMAGNVWEWCLDEWDSHWLTNMGDNPVDPCNYQKQTRRGLTLDQIKSLTIQYQETKKQNPFQFTEYCGVAHGSLVASQFSTYPLEADTHIHRVDDSTFSDSDAPPKKEVKKNEDPFLQKVSVVAHGIIIVPVSSAPQNVMDTTCLTDFVTIASDAVSTQHIKRVNKLPFQEIKSYGVVHGLAILLPPSEIPFEDSINN